MKQQRNSCFSSRAACLALALCGLGSFMGLGWTGTVQAGPLALSQSAASADRAGTADYAVRVNRGSTERKCPRSSDGCEKPPSCKPGILVCHAVVEPMQKP